MCPRLNPTSQWSEAMVRVEAGRLSSNQAPGGRAGGPPDTSNPGQPARHFESGTTELNRRPSRSDSGGPLHAPVGGATPQAVTGVRHPDRVRRPRVDPVLGGEVVERRQPVGIVGDLLHRLGELRPVGPRERRDSLCSSGVFRAHPRGDPAMAQEPGQAHRRTPPRGGCRRGRRRCRRRLRGRCRCGERRARGWGR